MVLASLLSEIGRMRSCSILLKGLICIWIHPTDPWHEAIFQYFVNVDLFVDFGALKNKNQRDFPSKGAAAQTITGAGFWVLLAFLRPEGIS